MNSQTSLLGRAALLLCTALMLTPPLKADGVMRPVSTSYPQDFLRHKLTRVDVAFHGQVAVTTVYQEFVNEWTQKTDAVYSFPLAADARATDFLFWSNDTVFRAPLKIKEQASNPGTGEGGVDAALTRYLGSNALRVLLKDIPAGVIQRVQMEYISLCRYDRGKLIYTYPLETAQFTAYPVDGLFITLRAENADEITAVELPGLSGAVVRRTDARHLTVSLDRTKAYLTSDIVFTMTTAPDTLSVDLQATNIDTLGGHFVLFVKPQRGPDTSNILPKDVVFLLDRSASTTGVLFAASVQATKGCLERLRPGDRFNIRTFNTTVGSWRPGLVPVTLSALDSARSYLDNLTTGGSSLLESALTQALKDFPADGGSDVLILFSDGRSAVDPKRVRTANVVQAGIYPVAVGPDVRRPLLEMLAYENYGMPVFIASADAVPEDVRWLFDQINDPVLKGVSFEMGPAVFDLYPRLPQALFGGSRFYLTGRFRNAGTTSLAIGGMAADGPRSYGYLISFPPVVNERDYAARFWAKERIDEIERQIAVYGATDSLKRMVIDLSLRYRIRCMYTAYIAEKTIPVSDVEEADAVLQSVTVRESAEGPVIRVALQNPGSVRTLHIYRAVRADGEYVLVNADPVGAGVFVDRGAPSGEMWYRVEIITADGRKVMSPPVSARSSVLPAAHGLEQNYPNPFNPSTTLRFAVAPEHGLVPVTLTVYDALGREVRTLVSGPYAAGNYQSVWDGTDNRAVPVSAGVYYCRIRAGSFTRTRALLLVR